MAVEQSYISVTTPCLPYCRAGSEFLEHKVVEKAMAEPRLWNSRQCSATRANVFLLFSCVSIYISIPAFGILLFIPKLSVNAVAMINNMQNKSHTEEKTQTEQNLHLSLFNVSFPLSLPIRGDGGGWQGGGTIPAEQPNYKNMSAVAKSPIYFQMMCSNGMLLYIFWWDRSLFKKTGAFECAFKPRLSIRTTSRVQWLGKKMTVMKSWEGIRRKER